MPSLWYRTSHAIHQLPGPLARFAFKVAQEFMQRIQCRRGFHFRAGSFRQQLKRTRELL